MGFYYFSIFSIVPLGIAYGMLFLVYWGIARLTRGIPGRKALLVVVGMVFLILPVAEELWIAWNFGQACKEAGTFIYKKVQVEGFYDSTMRSAYENTRAGHYQFVEHATEDRKGIERVQLADDEARVKALTWFTKTYPGKERPKGKSLKYPVSDREQIVVFPNGVDAWRVTKLDRPTARYHYRWPKRNATMGHKTYNQIEEVIDLVTSEILGRTVQYGRTSPWFFAALDDPGMTCPVASEKRGLLLYRLVLEPAASK